MRSIHYLVDQDCPLCPARNMVGFHLLYNTPSVTKLVRSRWLDIGLAKPSPTSFTLSFCYFITLNGFSTSLYFLDLLLVLPSVITITTWGTFGLSPPLQVNNLDIAISMARSVLVPPGLYFKFLIASIRRARFSAMSLLRSQSKNDLWL